MSRRRLSPYLQNPGHGHRRAIPLLLKKSVIIAYHLLWMNLISIFFASEQ